MIPLIPIVIGAGAVIAGTVALSFHMNKIKEIALKEGFEKASKEFNSKFQKQYEDFISKEKTWEKNRQEYEELIKAYKEYIDELMRENEELRREKTSAALASVCATVHMTPFEYSSALEKEISIYKEQLNNLICLRG